MEELKNENVSEQLSVEEPIIEQRPSTKYGRTAYQQQLQEELAAQRQQERDSEQAQQNTWQEQHMDRQQEYRAYTPYEEVKPVTNPIVVRILMVVVAIVQVISFATNAWLSKAYSMGETIEEVVDATLMLAEETPVWVLTTISDVLFWVTVALVVFDIMQLQRAGKKITGAILFAIFLRPAYFIWRAHLLGQKKTGAIIYAVSLYMITFAQYYILFSAATEMVLRTVY